MKPERKWWDMSPEKKPRVHSVAFLQKQAEKATIDPDINKFALENRPYYIPLPDAIYVRGRYEIVKRIEKRLPRVAKRLTRALLATEPKKSHKREIVSTPNGYFTRDVKENDKIVEVPEVDD